MSSGSSAYASVRTSLPPSSSSASAAASGSASGGGGGGGGGSSGASLNSNTTTSTTVEPVVVDLGVHALKFGIAGEPRPRAVVSTTAYAEPNPYLVAHPNPACAHVYGATAQLDATGSSNSSISGVSPTAAALWDLDFSRCRDERVRKEKVAYLLARLTHLFRNIFNHNLLCDPRTRRVILIENPLMPTVVKECVYTVLFKRLQVPAITPLPSPLLALLALGMPTGLLLNLGHLEASITPIYHGTHLASSLAHPASLPIELSSTKAAGVRLSRRLRALLIAFGHIVVSPPPNPGAGRAATAAAAAAVAARGSAVSHRASQLFTSLPTAAAMAAAAGGGSSGQSNKSRIEPVTAADIDSLGPDFLEQIKAKALLIGAPIVNGVETLAASLQPRPSLTRSAKSSLATATTASEGQLLPLTPGGSRAPTDLFPMAPSSPYDSPFDTDTEYLDALKTRYTLHTSSKPSEDGRPATEELSILLPHQSPVTSTSHHRGVPGLTLSGTSASAHILASASTPSQHRLLVVPAWVRERCAEILFEPTATVGSSRHGQRSTGDDEGTDGDLGDADEEGDCSLTELVLKALSQLPLPLRRHFASRLAVAGGTAQLPGLAHRLRVEVVRALEALERVQHFADVYHRPREPGRSPRSSSDSTTQGYSIGDEGDRQASSASQEPMQRSPRSVPAANKARRIRRSEAESALLADVPSLPTHELPPSWRRRYAPLGSLWRYVRVVNDHRPPPASAAAGIPVRVGPVASIGGTTDDEERDRIGQGLHPSSAAANTRISRRRRRSGTVGAGGEDGYDYDQDAHSGHGADDVKDDEARHGAYVPIYAASEAQALRKAHEHDVRYGLLPPRDPDRSKVYEGVAPSLAPSLLPWIGGSLVGALRVVIGPPKVPLDLTTGELSTGTRAHKSDAPSSALRRGLSSKDVNAMAAVLSPSETDEYANPVRRALHMNGVPTSTDPRILGPVGKPKTGQSVLLPVPVLDSPGTITREHFLEDDAVRRRHGLASFGAQASVSGGGLDAEAVALLGGQGSFVGVVGGLDTGAYGGLAAVSRHMRGAWAATGGPAAAAAAVAEASAPTSPRKEQV